jgi:hypothetical protein
VELSGGSFKQHAGAPQLRGPAAITFFDLMAPRID